MRLHEVARVQRRQAGRVVRRESEPQAAAVHLARHLTPSHKRASLGFEECDQNFALERLEHHWKLVDVVHEEHALREGAAGPRPHRTSRARSQVSDRDPVPDPLVARNKDRRSREVEIV